MLANLLRWLAPGICTVLLHVSTATAAEFTIRETRLTGLGITKNMQVDLISPVGDGAFPAVLVLHTSGNVQTADLDYARELARKGYIAVVPYYFSAYGITSQSRTDATTVYGGRLFADFVSILQYIRENLNVRKIGVVGFSMGGYWALTLAATKHVAAGVAFYGAISGGGPGLTLAYPLTQIFPADNSPVLILHGSNDSTVPVSLANNLASTLTATGSTHELIVYQGAEHTFDRGTTLNVTARDDGYSRAQAHLDKHVGASQSTLNFAQFGGGQGFSSDLVLANPSGTTTASGKVDFFDDNGVPLVTKLLSGTASSGAISVPPLGSFTLSTDPAGTLAVGSARVTVDNPVGGVIRFSLPGLGITGVGESLPLSAFVTPVRRKPGGVNTGVALRNTEITEVIVDLTLRNTQGQTIATDTRTLPPGGHVAKFISELFPNAVTEDFDGTLLVKTRGGKLAGTALELGSTAGQFTTLPVIPLK